MEYKSLKINFEDERGIIMDVISHVDVQHCTIITSKKGAFRGDHFHKFSGQYTFVISGEVTYVSRKNGTSDATVKTLKKSDLAFSPPNEEHGFLALEDSMLLILTYGPRGGEDYEKDVYRLSAEESLKKFIS